MKGRGRPYVIYSGGAGEEEESFCYQNGNALHFALYAHCRGNCTTHCVATLSALMLLNPTSTPASPRLADPHNPPYPVHVSNYYYPYIRWWGGVGTAQPYNPYYSTNPPIHHTLTPRSMCIDSIMCVCCITWMGGWWGV